MLDDVFNVFTTAFAEKIFKRPGAMIRWVYYRGKRNFKEILAEQTNDNLVVGLIGTLPLYILIAYFLERIM